MDSVQVVSVHYDQEDFWDPVLYSLPETGPVEFPGSYATASIDATFPHFSIHPNRNPISQDVKPDQPNSWASPDQICPTIEPIASPEIEPLNRAKVLLPPDPRPPIRRKPRKPPSGEALERRRQQNRVAQLAYRERSKTKIEELRLELALCVDFNFKMQDGVRALLGRAGGLQGDLEAILSLKMPVPSLYTFTAE